jgi:Xaa-Pro aminopeptidase
MLDVRANRARLLERLGPDEAVLVFGAPEHLRNGDSHYKYRPDLFWLTGWEGPDSAALIRPGGAPLVLFVQPKDPDREVWDGYRPGVEGARLDFGADEAFAMADLPAQLPRLLSGVETLHYGFGRDADHDALVVGAVRKGAKEARTHGRSVPEVFVAPSRLLHELRLRKSAAELDLLRSAARTSAAAHVEAMRATRPGATEYGIEAVLMGAFLRQGSTGPGYSPIVATGAHATTLHYVTNRATLAEGDLLLVDAGCEMSWYTADITRTWPVNGRFSRAQRDVYEVVLDAQLRCIEAVRPGADLGAIHDVAVRRLTEGMVALGLLAGPVDARIADGSYRRFYMHFTSHWLGLDVHDVGSYGRGGVRRPFEPGMVLTVEPGLYIPADATDIDPSLRGIGVRIEDDVVVTEGGCEVLSAGVPKEVDAIERCMAEARVA